MFSGGGVLTPKTFPIVTALNNSNKLSCRKDHWIFRYATQDHSRCMVPFSMTLSDTWPWFADYAVARCLSVRPSVCHTPVFCRNGSM